MIEVIKMVDRMDMTFRRKDRIYQQSECLNTSKAAHNVLQMQLQHIASEERCMHVTMHMCTRPAPSKGGAHENGGLQEQYTCLAVELRGLVFVKCLQGLFTRTGRIRQGSPRTVGYAIGREDLKVLVHHNLRLALAAPAHVDAELRMEAVRTAPVLGHAQDLQCLVLP